jgi:hypothetical protein
VRRPIRTRPLTLAALGAIRVSNGTAASAGGGLTATLRLPPPWTVGADLYLETQTEAATSADVRITRATVGPRAGVRTDVSGFELDCQVGFRFGQAFLSGTPAPRQPPPAPGSLDGPWGGPFLSLTLQSVQSFSFGFGIEAGWTVFEIEADLNDGAVTRLSGPWLLSSIVLGISL